MNGALRAYDPDLIIVAVAVWQDYLIIPVNPLGTNLPRAGNANLVCRNNFACWFMHIRNIQISNIGWYER